MGVAFTDVSFCGGLYPCASFNRQEKIRFNFGSRPLKYASIWEDEGYRPYVDHVLDLQNTPSTDFSTPDDTGRTQNPAAPTAPFFEAWESAANHKEAANGNQDSDNHGSGNGQGNDADADW